MCLQKLVRNFKAYIQLPRHFSALCVRDFRNYSPDISLNLLILYEYLIFTGNESQPCPQERFSEMTNRLCSLFGSGWFFEWPGGKRPLNSTWPWADVKPSLLVLWGVCWMFVVAPIQGQGRNPNQRRDHRSPLQPGRNDYYYTQAGE